MLSALGHAEARLMPVHIRTADRIDAGVSG
jgi:hypothetical protein